MKGGLGTKGKEILPKKSWLLPSSYTAVRSRSQTDSVGIWLLSVWVRLTLFECSNRWSSRLRGGCRPHNSTVASVFILIFHFHRKRLLCSNCQSGTAPQIAFLLDDDRETLILPALGRSRLLRAPATVRLFIHESLCGPLRLLMWVIVILHASPKPAVHS